MRSAHARHIPSIERLRQSPRARSLEHTYGREALVSALRAAADTLRASLSARAPEPAAHTQTTGAGTRAETGTGSDSSSDSGVDSGIVMDSTAGSDGGSGVHTSVDGDTGAGRSSPAGTPRPMAEDIEAHLLDEAAALLSHRFQSRLISVINATGVVLHTNLGRAPLADEAMARVRAAGAGYVALEYDLAAGERGRRDVHAEALLRDLTGAAAAIVVNNNAAAVLLMLTALASGREVLISRGELVEIGGGFRVPDVMRQSGALLREVGTTNRTRVADYAAAISDRTALILRVHPSNFVIEGFAERPDVRELTALGRQFGVPVVEDLGSGFFGGIEGLDEPTVQHSVQAGVDVVTFSGDKLLGGPQAGIIAGTRALVDVMRRHPLMRALRVDKLTYAALEGTLIELARGRATEAVPVSRMLALTVEAIGARAAALALRLSSAGLRATVMDGLSAVGGGSAPATRLPTRLVVLHPLMHAGSTRADMRGTSEGRAADDVLARLRGLTPPVIARIDNQRVVLDLRTVDPAHDELIGDLLLSALAAQ